MAKGNRGGKGKKTTQAVKDSIDLNGDIIEFDGILQYTKDDSSINAIQRQFLDAWESKRAKAKVEYANAVGFNGSEYGEIRGSKGRINIPKYYTANKGSVLTHIHPRENGMFGGTFSDMDINNFAKGNGQVMRAVAKEGTYSISRGKNFDPSGLMKHYTSVSKQRDKDVNNAKAQLTKLARSGQISYPEANKRLRKVFNNSLIALHNDLINNQKTYGYNYYLERR